MAVARGPRGRARRSLIDNDSVHAAVQDYITARRGAVWGRDGLDRRSRNATLAVLTALHCHGEIGMRARRSRNGLTPDEISEVLHTRSTQASRRPTPPSRSPSRRSPRRALAAA
jgi:alkylhydroperoxidase/carboxymuconolactone decarboxylase family protein YurZ